MAMEIVDVPINSMVIFHCYVKVHQRVMMMVNITDIYMVNDGS